MKEFIKYQRLDVDSINGEGIQITYNLTSFDKTEIDKMEEWCKKHIDAGLILDGVVFKGDIEQ